MQLLRKAVTCASTVGKPVTTPKGSHDQTELAFGHLFLTFPSQNLDPDASITSLGPPDHPNTRFELDLANIPRVGCSTLPRPSDRAAQCLAPRAAAFCNRSIFATIESVFHHLRDRYAPGMNNSGSVCPHCVGMSGFRIPFRHHDTLLQLFLHQLRIRHHV